MKRFLVIIVVVFGIWLLLSSSSGNSSSYNSSDYGSDESRTNMDRYDALSDHWDEIAEYINGIEEVEACSGNSGNCYTLEADISSGDIETLMFPNGGNIDFYDMSIDSNGKAEGYDDNVDYWTLEINESVIDTALENWAEANDITLE